MKRLAMIVFAFSALALAACSSGPVRRVSAPSANIQQLSVAADGAWSIDLRIDNFSSVPMRFDNITLVLTVDGQSAGTLQGQPSLSIGPEAADVATLKLQPASAAKIAIADALARNRSISYHLHGSLVATPDKGSSRSFEVDRDNALSPVPGLAGVLR